MSDVAARERLQAWGAEIAIVLGSGLASLTKEIATEHCIAYSGFAELPAPRVPGHTGQFVLDTIGGTKVIFAQGRVHLYEGHSAARGYGRDSAARAMWRERRDPHQCRRDRESGVRAGLVDVDRRSPESYRHDAAARRACVYRHERCV